jgi:hypothetical protein
MYGPTCIFWANLTPFSLKLILVDNNLAGPARLSKVGKRMVAGQHDAGTTTVRSRTVRSSGAEAVAQIIKSHASDIKVLDLSENPLGRGGCDQLVETFSNSTCALAVETLALRNCSLGDEGTESLLSLLGEWCPYLTSIDLGMSAPNIAHDFPNFD